MMVLMTCSHWSRMVDVDVDAVVKQDGLHAPVTVKLRDRDAIPACDCYDSAGSVSAKDGTCQYSEPPNLWTLDLNPEPSTQNPKASTLTLAFNRHTSTFNAQQSNASSSTLNPKRVRKGLRQGKIELLQVDKAVLVPVRKMPAKHNQKRIIMLLRSKWPAVVVSWSTRSQISRP
eukprot:3370662-Rhodomonas_salina.5